MAKWNPFWRFLAVKTWTADSSLHRKGDRAQFALDLNVSAEVSSGSNSCIPPSTWCSPGASPSRWRRPSMVNKNAPTQPLPPRSKWKINK